jgi:hypothetical protein
MVKDFSALFQCAIEAGLEQIPHGVRYAVFFAHAESVSPFIDRV